MAPNTVLILGGGGKVARRLTSLLVAADPPHAVHSVVRSNTHVAALRELGATPHIHSIEDTTVDELASKIRDIGPSAIVWAAGAGGGDPARTTSVDRDGAIRAMDAAAAAGVRRFVLVSAIDVRDRDAKPAPEWYSADDKTKSDKVWGAIGAYMKAKLAADRELRAGNGKRRLDYTIVRPSGLLDDDGVGKVAAGKVGLDKSISRSDVAAVVLECLKNSGTIGLAFDVIGGDTPVAQAVAKIADEKIDCFEGYY